MSESKEKLAVEPPNPDLSRGWILDADQALAFSDFVASRDGVTGLANLYERATESTFDTAKKYIFRFRKPGSYMTIGMRDEFAKAGGMAPSKFGELLKLPPLGDQNALPARDRVAPKAKPKHPKDRLEFSEFFGPAVLNDERPIQLVLPKRVLTREVERSDAPPFKIEKQCTFYRGKRKWSNVWPEGVTGYVAFENVLAANHLANVIVEKTGQAPWLRQENNLAVRQGRGDCVISLGLGFSAASHLAINSFDPPLFTIYCAPSPKRFRHSFTDHFTLKDEAKLSGGEVDADFQGHVPVPKEGDVAIIVRVVPIGKSERPQPLFIAAGRTAPGTESAAHYLAYRWKEIMDIYERADKSLHKDSLALVIRHDAPPRSIHDERSDSGSSIAESAEQHYWDKGKKHACIAFGIWSDPKSRASRALRAC